MSEVSGDEDIGRAASEIDGLTAFVVVEGIRVGVSVVAAGDGVFPSGAVSPLAKPLGTEVDREACAVCGGGLFDAKVKVRVSLSVLFVVEVGRPDTAILGAGACVRL